MEASPDLIVPGRRLGRLPRDPGRPVLHLASYLTGTVPAPDGMSSEQVVSISSIS